MLLPRSGKVGLKWKFGKGSSLRYEMTQSMQMDREDRGSKELTLFGMQMEITDVIDGVATIRVTYDRIKVKASGMMESEYDSAKDEKPHEGDLRARVMAAMVGKSFRMKLEDTGRVVEVTGFSDMMAEILKNLGVDTGMASHLEGQFNDGQVKAMMETALPRLPQEAVVEGTKWKDETTLSIHGLGEVAAKSTSKVTAIKGAAVDFKTRVGLEFDTGEGADGDTHGRAEIWDASVGGKSAWDAVHGLLMESKTEIRITAETHGQEFELMITSTMRWAPRKGE
jgi:hypothetical protein